MTMTYNTPSRIGYAVIPVLEFLHGDPWGDRILDFIHALRPTELRIIPHNGMATCDSVPWRVTVLLNQDNLVTRIEQEVEVGLRTADHGHGLMNKIPRTQGVDGGDDGIVIVNSRAVKMLLKGRQYD